MREQLDAQVQRWIAELSNDGDARIEKGEAMIAAMLIAAQTMIAVPEPMRHELDAVCDGWQLAPVLPEIDKEIRTRTPSWPANLIPGDFNVDRQTDVAVLVECKGTVQLHRVSLERFRLYETCARTAAAASIRVSSST